MFKRLLNVISVLGFFLILSGTFYAVLGIIECLNIKTENDCGSFNDVLGLFGFGAFIFFVVIICNYIFYDKLTIWHRNNKT
jgi:hypothetical protein